VPANSLHPYHPIIYVRGFAATQDEIEETVADPYMGFNIGSTKSRTVWSGETRRFFFESPLVRLMRDHKYSDVFEDGEDGVNSDRPDRPLPYRSIVIYRYYDEASKDFGDGGAPPIEHFARGLGRLILRLRDKVCAHPKNGVAPDDFRVYLVAHSMGGLVCRACQSEFHSPSRTGDRVDDYIPLRKRHTCQTDARSGSSYHQSRCFSVSRWQRLTLPDPSQRWDFESHTERCGIFFSDPGRSFASSGHVWAGSASTAGNVAASGARLVESD